METIAAFPIRLDGKSYHIEIGSWKARDVTDFSPKTTVPGTGAVFGDLQLYQPIAQSNWQHGLGYIWHEDEAGYLRTDGYIDTRHKGVVSLFTNSVQSDTNDNTKTQGLVFSGNFFTVGAGGLRYFNGTSWAAANVRRPVYDNTSENSGTGVANAGTVTLSHTVTTEGGNRALFAGVAIEDSTNVTNVTATYAGEAMTLVTGSSTGTTPNVRAFYILGPATGANDIVVTYTISSGTIETVVIGASFLDVHQSTPYDTVTTENSTGATTNTITPTADSRELVLDFLAKDGLETDNAAAASGQTEIAEDDESTGADIHLCSSYEYTTSADSTPDLTWTWTNSRDYAHVAIPIEPLADGTMDFMFENGEYLFVQPNGARLLKSQTGTDDFTPAGLNNKSNDYTWLEIHGGYIFGGKTSEAEVYFDTNSDLSALAGDPGDDADEMVAGPGTVGTLKGISFLEKLAVSRQDGLWTMDTDDATTTNWISKRTLNFKNLRSSVNFRDMATWAGSLYFSIQDKIFYQWNGAKLQNITPAPITDAWEYITYYRFDNFTPFGDWLLLSARTSGTLTAAGHTGYSEAILAWDGVGFHKICEPITDGDGSISMISIDPENNYIWYHLNRPTAGNDTYYLQYQATSDLPHANFPTSGTHRLTTSRIHAGFRRVDKSMAALWVETDNLSSTRTIQVQYAIDDGTTWYTWQTLTSSGEHVLYLPRNQLTQEFKYIRLRFVFVTDASTQTPILEGYAMMVMMRPDFKMGYSFDVIGGNAVTSGMVQDGRNSYSIMHDLRGVRDKKEPVELVTPFGDRVYGYLTSITENAVEWEPEDFTGGETNILQVIRCNFVETIAVEGTEGELEPSW